MNKREHQNAASSKPVPHVNDVVKAFLESLTVEQASSLGGEKAKVAVVIKNQVFKWTSDQSPFSREEFVRGCLQEASKLACVAGSVVPSHVRSRIPTIADATDAVAYYKIALVVSPSFAYQLDMGKVAVCLGAAGHVTETMQILILMADSFAAWRLKPEIILGSANLPRRDIK